MPAMRPRGDKFIASLVASSVCLMAFAAAPAFANAPPPPFENPKRDVAKLQKLAVLAKKGVLQTPNAGSKAEIAHNERHDAAVAPLLDTEITAEDLAALREARQAVSKKSFTTARDLRTTISDATARKMIDWLLLRAGDGTIAQYEAFLSDNPLWPNRWLLVRRLEEKLFKANDADEAIRYFAASPPKSAPGKMAQADARRRTGDAAGGKALAAATWRDDDIPAEMEEPILARVGDLLTPADHKWRLDRLLTRDFRWRASRKRHAAVVRRQMKRVSKAERTKARARLAVFLRQKSARKLMNALPEAAQSDWSLAYHRVQMLRRAKKHTEAAKLLLTAPTDKAEIINPDAWWVERRVNAYAALRKGNPKLAYKLAREAGPLSANEANEQAFTAGWLALRYLGDAKAARVHFEKMTGTADGPLSRSKAHYWMGRSLEAEGQAAEAENHYRKSARQFDTFHGHLSRQRLAGGKPLDIEIRPPAAPSDAQIARLGRLDAARAAVIADKAKLGRSISRPFLANLANTMETEPEVALVAHLTRAMGDTQQSLRIGKKAIARGMNLIYYSYPLHAFPDYKPLRLPPEPAFLLGIARQESEFNTAIVSGAGAKGILQVMTITAKHVCRDYKIKCQVNRLRTDEAYNTKIASAYIADRMGEFRGSYVLGLAGYNAGPGRARQWIRQFGDPRDGRIDPIDWIERIPFRETRRYVAKVLSNIQIYRARLEERRKPLRLMQDLSRAQAPTKGRKLRAPGALKSL